MKSPIKFLAIIALFFTVSFAANAQRGGESHDPEQMAEKETSRIVEKLSLDESQSAKAKEINLTYAKLMLDARDENKDNREAMKKIEQAINSEKSAEMKLVLTEAQFKTYEEMQAQKGKEKGGKGGKGGKGRQRTK